MKPKPGLAVGPGGDLEVVDLLQLRLGLARLVVLVRRVGGPVAAGVITSQAMILAAVERVRSAEVAHLAAGLAGAAQLDRNLGGRQVAQRQRRSATRAAQREPPAVARIAASPTDRRRDRRRR